MTAIEKFDAASAAYLRNATFTGKSADTLENYRYRLLRFREAWLAAHDGVPEHDPDFTDVLNYRDGLLENGAAASTVRQYLVELRAFFDAMEKPRFVPGISYPENPVDTDFYPVVKKRPYDMILTDDQVKMLLPYRKPENAKKATWTRNYAFVALILATKIRNSELLSLTLADLDFEAGELTVNHGKGDKFRVVDFPPFAQAAVLLYLQSGLRPGNLPDSAPLFGTTAEHKASCGATDSGEWHKGSDVWLSECVRRHVLAVTGVDNVRTHDLRHVGARLYLNAGASMEFLQSELGHSSMSTTQIYSGRLQARRGRNSAKEILADMERVAASNMTIWELHQPAEAM